MSILELKESYKLRNILLKVDQVREKLGLNNPLTCQGPSYPSHFELDAKPFLKNFPKLCKINSGALNFTCDKNCIQCY